MSGYKNEFEYCSYIKMWLFTALFRTCCKFTIIVAIFVLTWPLFTKKIFHPGFIQTMNLFCRIYKFFSQHSETDIKFRKFRGYWFLQIILKINLKFRIYIFAKICITFGAIFFLKNKMYNFSGNEKNVFGQKWWF